MAAHSVELLFDDDTERALLDQWRSLAAAGLPSQAQHTGATNRPHVTVAVADAVDPGADGALRALAPTFPLTCRVGAPLLFGRRRLVLARLLVPTHELLAVHAAVHTACEPHLHPAPYPHSRPGQWTPHVTLARGLTAEQVASALAVTAGAAELTGSFVALRRWDPDTRRVHPLV